MFHGHAMRKRSEKYLQRTRTLLGNEKCRHDFISITAMIQKNTQKIEHFQLNLTENLISNLLRKFNFLCILYLKQYSHNTAYCSHCQLDVEIYGFYARRKWNEMKCKFIQFSEKKVIFILSYSLTLTWGLGQFQHEEVLEYMWVQT